jgi:hypothetical protein
MRNVSNIGQHGTLTIQVYGMTRNIMWLGYSFDPNFDYMNSLRRKQVQKRKAIKPQQGSPQKTQQGTLSENRFLLSSRHRNVDTSHVLCHPHTVSVPD